MRYLMSFVIVTTIFISGCRQSGQTEQSGHPGPEEAEALLLSDTHMAFFENLKQLCGNAYTGTQVYRSHHGSSWAHLEMVMHVRDCSSERIAIPFRVGDNNSRTWLFLVEDGKLRFRHDHRHEDGSPEDESLYGGYADENGTAFVQYFPADAYTAELIEDGGGNLWTVSISEDFSVFTYMLERDGEKRFQIDFDLNKPVRVITP